MNTTRITTRIPVLHANPQTSWTVLDPRTGQCRVVRREEFFPIAGRLLSGVWQLDDGRVLIATSSGDGLPLPEGQPTVRVAYLDTTAPVLARAANR